MGVVPHLVRVCFMPYNSFCATNSVSLRFIPKKKEKKKEEEEEKRRRKSNMGSWHTICCRSCQAETESNLAQAIASHVYITNGNVGMHYPVNNSPIINTR